MLDNIVLDKLADIIETKGCEGLVHTLSSRARAALHPDFTHMRISTLRVQDAVLKKFPIFGQLSSVLRKLWYLNQF